MGGGFEKGPDLTGDQIKQITDTNTLIQEALKNGALSGQEGKQIMARLNAEKAEITQETKQKLNDFLQNIQGWDGLKKAAQKVSTKPIEATPVTPAPAAELVESSPPAPTAEPTPAPAPADKPAEPPKSEAEKEKAQPSVLDTARNFVSGKLDIASLPKEDQATVKDLQDAGFTLKPVEGKKGEYTVDMNGLFDKSTLTILPNGKMKFSTDTLKFAGKDKEFNFKNVDEAKEMLTKINEYIKVSFEIKPLEDIYKTHRDFLQEERYKELDSKRKELKSDLGLEVTIK